MKGDLKDDLLAALAKEGIGWMASKTHPDYWYSMDVDDDVWFEVEINDHVPSFDGDDGEHLDACIHVENVSIERLITLYRLFKKGGHQIGSKR